ncbi:GMP synthase [glutamine-hydrolyzing] [Aeropyrum pernix K1]|uniref:GMP synthase [glutamine-hydrolyzing] n=1 Tax=Aeropyrum pernix (strain ATCC 700893 / DSM 11879 / JCM 9820 / NBRC 100138 / K1) TaxID=272557 RepID=GUAA_AERPE|nr:RecName: Full=GMP synthase [glutamine-hydrolyzing]; AltName: Full=GMP synthetase; AltName: Full=Glutamine amidotransferase [Aeropyrum pernix K1]BAA81467.1 GMP synthase [glutamine-hydrolyzing] [Aeropyrum pernix K1]
MAKTLDSPGVLVVDFGGQYAHLIARRIRELGVYSEIVPATSLDALGEALPRAAGVVLSGGPGSVWGSRHDEAAAMVLQLGKPVLGICYGHQLLAKVLGGEVGRSPLPEFGPTEVEVLDYGILLNGLPSRFKVWMSHYDAVLRPPGEAKVLARTPGSPVAAMELWGRVFGVQWHPEVRHTQYGREVLDNWLSLVGAPRTWRPGDMVSELVESVKKEVGDALAVAAVSGGVDSTVAALIAKKAIGSRLYPVFIDHGLHPEGEVERVVKLLSRLGLEPVMVDAGEEFLAALEGVGDPEEKRRVVGRVYAEVLERAARDIGAEYLVQGTIYPDVIESGARPGADTIKTHHNVGGLPKDMRLKLVEPLRYFYKDEVRLLAEKLGVPRELIWKQPVPGPGLAVRVEGPITREKLRIVRRADAIVREEVEAAGLGGKLWQYFAVLTASMATGVRGDSRSYGYVVAVRAVESVDAMTAKPAELPWWLLERIARRITSEIPEVVRVVYDITSKPPSTIEWE